tara:strand:+ start:1683 stop:2699 length:1017 start_codon:yes stop_codon:yes gene_type:complete
MTETAFITGITGMVGSHLLDFLLENTSWNIHGLLRWRSPLDNISHHVSKINNDDRVFLHYGDITDYASLEVIFKLQKFDYVFHLAAQSYPKTSFDAPNNTYQTNIIGTENVLKACLSFCPDATIHNCSSSEVFGRVPKHLVPIVEDTPFHPASPYAISKCSADLIGRHYAEAYNLRVLTTRMFTHTGPRRGDVFMESTFAKQIALIERNFLPPVVKTGNLESIRTIADVRDAVKAYFLLVTSQNIPSGSVFNIGGTFTASVKTILEKLISLSTNKSIIHQIDPSRIRPIDADLQIPNTKKFKEFTNWEPNYSFDQTMRDLLEYWRQLSSTYGNKFLQR